jgi:uncharacterized protein (TIGR00730 family)
MNDIRSVCVYCGSSPGRDPLYSEEARILGRSIAEHGLRLVYGGGTKGIMGAVADGCMSAGGRVTGIIPRFLMKKEATEQALGRLDDLIVTDNMHERKHAMFERSDAFVAMPGGIGTVEEIVEIMTWGQLGHHAKPVVFVSTAGFWRPFLSLIDHMKAEGFIHTAHLVNPLVLEQAQHVVPAIIEAAAKGAAAPAGDRSLIDRM